MALAGHDGRRLTAPQDKKQVARVTRHKSLPPSRARTRHREIERIKGVRYLGRRREKTPPWGSAR